MSSSSVSEQSRADELRALHVPGAPLLLANVWDAGGARLVAAAGAAAIATTSAGVAWSQGVPDGGGLDRAATLAVLERIVRAVSRLAELGVARVSLGASIAAASYRVVQQAAADLFGRGSYDALADAVDYSAMNALLGS